VIAPCFNLAPSAKIFLTGFGSRKATRSGIIALKYMLDLLSALNILFKNQLGLKLKL
jgi:hypothetical protein